MARTGNIADTLDREHGLHFTRGGAPAAVLSWAQASDFGVVQITEQDVVKINPPLVFVQPAEGDLMADKSFADEPEAALPFDLAIAAYAAHRPVGGITGRLRLASLAAAGPINLGRWLLVQGFMRPLFIVLAQPPAGAFGLLHRVGRGWPGGGGLEFPVPLFMSAIIFRMPGTIELNFNAQGDPPGAQP